MIELKDISKKYGTFNALEKTSLTIEKQKITTIIGENGSGKSTLLNIIARLTKSNSGDVFVEGTNTQNYESLAYARKVATLKQSNAINLRLKVLDLVAFGRYPHNQGQLSTIDKNIIHQALAFMQCLDFKEKYLDQLSGGQIQRVYIAMILAQDTEIILLDEPLNNLDLKHAHELMVLIQRLVKEQGKTIVMIVHDLNMVYRYADNVIALKKGRMICEGCVKSVLNEQTLKELYDCDFTIQSINNHKIAFIA